MSNLEGPVVERRHDVTLAAQRLLAADLPASEFFPKLLSALGESLRGSVGAVWMMSESRSLGLFSDWGLVETGLLDDPRQIAVHQKLLIEGWQRNETHVRAHCFLELLPESHVLLIPVRKQGSLVGLIEVFTSTEPSEFQTIETAGQFEEIVECVDRFLVRAAEATTALAPAKFVSLLEKFVARLHASLDPHSVRLFAVNELRLIFQCDRVSILGVKSGKARVRNVSGQNHLHRRARQVQLLEEITAQVIRTQRSFQFPHSEIDLPDGLAQLLSRYLDESGSQMLWIEPLFDRRPDDSLQPPKTSQSPRIIAALVCEQFQDSLPRPAMKQRIEPCSRQVGLALNNAQRHSRLKNVPTVKLTSFLWNSFTHSRLVLLAAIIAVLSGGGWAMLVLKQDLKVECSGHLVPAIQNDVYAPMNSEVVQVYVHESEQVEVGTPLLQLASPELESQRLELSSRINQKLKERDSVNVELRASIARQQRDQSARIQAQKEMLAAEIDAIEVQLQLLDQEQSRLQITAPISGTVVTRQPTESLLRKPAQRGEKLLEMMSEDGPWRLELEIPENRAGHLLQIPNLENLIVTYRLAADPERIWTTKISAISDRTTLSQRYGTAVVIFCESDFDELPQRRIGMDVTAQVNCGSQSLFDVYFGEMKEFLQRHWWL